MSNTGRVILAVCLAAGMALPATGADTGRILGRVVDELTGAGVASVVVRAFASGRSTGAAARSEADGSFALDGLSPGAYAVCTPAGESWRPVVAGVLVTSGGRTRLDVKLRRSLLVEGDSWLQPQSSFAQSYVAGGLGLTMIGVKAFGAAARVTLQVLEGEGPQGRPLGPSRTSDPVGGEGTAGVCWAGGEVPTSPGHHYTIRMAAPPGEAWVCGVPGRGNVYPLGMAWFSDSPRPHSDLGLVICEDNDGLRTNYSMSGAGRACRAISAGQTFVALSRNVTLASAPLLNTGTRPVYVRFSIHEGGPGGRQIGPSKNVVAEPDSAVAWMADEVPVTPGRSYYLHVESVSGDEFLINALPDGFAGGNAVFNGRPAPQCDLCALVGGRISEADFTRLVSHPACWEVIALANEGFEDGLAGWELAGQAGAVVGCDAGVIPCWGNRMFGWTKLGEGEGSRTILHRQVRVQAGRTYAFSGSVYTDHRGGRSSDVKIRLIVLPDGSKTREEATETLRDNHRIHTSQWYATEGQWRRGSVEFQAQADVITVGFDLEQRWSLESSSLYVDGAHLERIGAD